MYWAALVGYEREHAGKAAGVRTHGMVNIGAALFAVVSLHGFGGTGDPGMLLIFLATAALVFLLLRFGPRPRPKTPASERE